MAAARVLSSALDPSVNLLRKFGRGVLESRLVWRPPGKLCIYVSSQAGCNKGCQQCFLTATKQLSMKPATPTDFRAQVADVWEQFRKTNLRPQLKRINIEYMARGEPLANHFIRKDFAQIDSVIRQVLPCDIPIKHHISTIFPEQELRGLASLPFFDRVENPPTIFYSAWSIRETFKRKWMPAAMPTLQGLKLLADYGRRFGHDRTRLHSGFIMGENDSILNDVHQLISAAGRVGLRARYNVIRYNPPPGSPYQETTLENLKNIVQYIADHNLGGVRVVDRVGFDVYASCGMFVGSPDPPLEKLN